MYEVRERIEADFGGLLSDDEVAETYNARLLGGSGRVQVNDLARRFRLHHRPAVTHPASSDCPLVGPGVVPLPQADLDSSG